MKQGHLVFLAKRGENANLSVVDRPHESQILSILTGRFLALFPERGFVDDEAGVLRIAKKFAGAQSDLVHDILGVLGGVADELLKSLGIRLGNDVLHALHVFPFIHLAQVLRTLAGANGRIEAVDLEMPYEPIHESLEKPSDIFEAPIRASIVAPILWCSLGSLLRPGRNQAMEKITIGKPPGKPVWPPRDQISWYMIQIHRLAPPREANRVEVRWFRICRSRFLEQGPTKI